VASLKAWTVKCLFSFRFSSNFDNRVTGTFSKVLRFLAIPYNTASFKAFDFLQIPPLTPILCSGGRTRTYNQLLTRNPTLLRAWTISPPVLGASVSSLYGSLRFPRGCPSLRSGGSPLSQSYSICFPTEGCLVDRELLYH